MLWAWLADEAMGRPLADLLNHSQSLSRLLFSPWIVRQTVSDCLDRRQTSTGCFPTARGGW